MSDYALLLVGIGEGVVVILLLISVLLTKMYARRELLRTLAAFEAKSDKNFDEQMEVLRAVLDMAKNTRVHRQETDQVKQDVRQKMGTVVAAVEEVPDRVIQKLKENGVH